MKVYIDLPENNSKGILRVINALKRYKPLDIDITEDDKKADIKILHVNGRRNKVMREILRMKNRSQKFVAIQYAVRSTKTPHTRDWSYIWGEAKFVWSYYNIPELIKEDGARIRMNFYHSPLGCDPTVFRPLGMDRKYVIATVGPTALTESVLEAYRAAEAQNKMIFHLGPNLRRPNMDCRENITDEKLCFMLSQCKYVSGLRRVEGFELPAVEGLFCGARPIMFDKPHFRQWFDKWAIFIPETNKLGVIENLSKIFKEDTPSLTLEEIQEARLLFNWESIVKGFWKKVLE